MRFAASCIPGLESALADELASLGIADPTAARSVVTFDASLREGYRAMLWTRIASRVLVRIGRCYADSAKTLYAEARRVDWAQHVAATGTIAVDFVGQNEQIRNTRFGAMKIKDAVVDRLRDETGERPSVDLDAPDLRIRVVLRQRRAEIFVDLSGRPLHLRGHHRDGGPAPVRETLAAGLLRYANWHQLGPSGVPLVDPMCGSGTFLLEALDVLADRAPCLSRDRWGHEGWLMHEPRAWAELLEEARDRVRAVDAGQVFGRDRDRLQVRRTHQNLARAGFTGCAEISRAELSDFQPPPGAQSVPRGLLVTNPPYGERLGELDEAGALMSELGNILRRRCPGWTGWILAGSPALARKIGLKPASKREVRQGALDARWCEVPVRDEKVARDRD